MAKTARDRAQDAVDRIDVQITKVTERRDKQVKQVQDRFAGQLSELQAERQHLANAPALQPATPAEPVGDDGLSAEQ